MSSAVVVLIHEGSKAIPSVTSSHASVPHVPGVPAIRLQSKSAPPPVRDGSVERRALLARLAGSSATVVAVSAPPGYGKTTFLAQAAARERRAVAWVSLDSHDDDPAILASLLAAALHRIRPIDREVFKTIAAPALSPWSAVTRLSRAVEGHPALVLFVDDVDALAKGPAADVLDVLPELLPLGSQMVVAGRTSPPFELSRRRVAGTLLTVDRKDLALDDEEALQLAAAMGHHIDEATVARLNRRAEGWSAGMYLLLRATATDPGDAATAEPAGDSRSIAAYLRSEILEPLGPELGAFLRRTSFLERLSGPLCDAVLERTGSATILAQLERANRFVVPLDDRDVWYRDHHLLRDLLQADLAREDPAEISRLAFNASIWFEEHDSPAEAIECARLAGDQRRLARLLVTNTQIAFNAGNVATVQRWFDEVEMAPWMVRQPELAVTGAIYFALAGDPPRAGQWLHVATASRVVEPMSDGSPSIHAWLALCRAIMAQNGASPMLADAAIAVDQIPTLSPWRTAALGTLGIAYYLAGDDRTAEATLANADHASIPPAAASARALALAYRAILAIERSDWTAAEALIKQARDVVVRSSLDELALISVIFALSARVAMRRGNRTQAARDQAHAHRLRAGLSEAIPWLAVGTDLELARLALAQSDAAGTRALVAEASDILGRFPSFGRLDGDVVQLRQQAAAAASFVVGASALTAAELRLLPYLSTYLSFREIGQRVGVSANTIKSQTMSIYRKLDVSSRGDAIARAAAIGLTEPIADPGFRGDAAADPGPFLDQPGS